MLDYLRKLAPFLPALESGTFDFGHWEGGEKRPDGTITAPYYEFSQQALDLIAAMPVHPFDWSKWMGTQEAQALIADHANIASATPEQLVKLATSMVRSDRFTEGSLAGAHESGLLTAVVRRASVLV
jgi:hypothetical protein